MTPRFWQAVETVHDVVYFAPEAQARFEALGLKGWWMGYFASRSAALGTPSPRVVTALFHGFAPRMAERSLPDAWDLAARNDILAARLDIARSIVAPATGTIDQHRLAVRLSGMLDHIDWAGKPLGAAHAALAVPDDDLGRMWHAATALREYRGDCHVAVLTAAGLDGAAANKLAQAVGLATDRQQAVRGWTDDEWLAAIERLRQRGWTDEFGVATEAGRAARRQLESATDRVCAAGIDEEGKARALTSEPDLVQVAHALIAAGSVPYPNPTAAQPPETSA